MSAQARSLAAVGVAVLIIGITPQAASAQDEAAIRRLPIEEWCRAESARDLDAKMALFDQDAVVMPPDGQNVVGLSAIRAWHEAVWKESKYECSGTVDEVKMMGDWGFALGTFSGLTTPMNGGTPTQGSGKFINLVRRQADGTWKLARVIWNTK